MRGAYSNGWPREQSAAFQTFDEALAWTEQQAATPGWHWAHPNLIVSDDLQQYKEGIIDGKIWRYYAHRLPFFQNPGPSGGSGSCSAWTPGVVESRFGPGDQHYTYGLDHMFPDPLVIATAGFNNCLVSGVYYRVKGFPLLRVVQVDIPNACPPDYTPSGSVCVITVTEVILAVDGNPKELGGSCNNKFNPCNVATGNKYESETDYSATNGLAFVRHYNSQDTQNRGLGVGWTSNLHRSLELSGTSLTVRQADGRGEPWVNNAGTWTGDPDTNLQLTEDAAGYTLTMPDDRIERYDLNGKLISDTTAAGLTTSYAYDTNGRLETVTGPFGHSLTLGYDPANGWLDTLTDPAGNVYRYEYTTQGSSYVLSEVTYPDETPGDNTDNPKRIYHYEDPNFPDFLTGITDENGDRFATFAYGADGQAISTEHATTDNPGPQEKYQLSY